MANDAGGGHYLMPEEITLTTPITIGDLDNQTIIDRLKVVAISFNRQASHEAAGTVVLSILLEHPGSGWTYNVVYRGVDALIQAKLINTGDFSTKSLQMRILEKLLADDKLPPGIVSGAPE